MKKKVLSVLIFTAFSISVFISCDNKEDEDQSSSVCGDSMVTHMEKCDGENLDGQTCETLGFGAGTLSCADNCLEFDTSECGPSLTCGDGIKNGTDVCDGDDLGGETCISRGFEDGILKCLPNCAGFDTSQCGKSVTCGNGKIDSGEVCDGTELNGRTCEHEGFEQGELKCSDDCKSFDTSDCYTPCTPECGDRECGLDPVCGEPCGECTGSWEACNEKGQCEKTCDFEPIEKDEVLDINLETVNVSGSVTLNGAAMPNNTQQYYEDHHRGRLVFTNKESGSTYNVSIGHSGAATYNAKLFKGQYDVAFHPVSESYQNVLPGVNIRLEENVEMSGTVIKNYNLETAVLSGTVTLNNSTMPNNTQQYYEDHYRGRIIFRNKSSSDAIYVSIGHSGAANYSVKLFKGSYDVDFDSNNESYQNVLPGQRIRVYKGCFDYSKDCSEDIDNITGRWDFIPDGAHWTPTIFHLVQNGDEITGTFEAPSSSGSIKPGIRSGNYIRFQYKPYYDMIVDGNIVSGCTILGRFDTIGYSGPSYDSDFVGHKMP